MDPNYNPHLKYNNQRDHGYILLTLNKEEAIAQFKVVETIRSRSDKEKTDLTARVKSGAHDISIEKR